MKRVAILAAAVLVVAAGCGPDSGRVYDRKYYPQMTYPDTMCVSYKDGRCTNKIPTVRVVPAKWYVCIDNGQEHGCKLVSHTTYDRYPVGSNYP